MAMFTRLLPFLLLCVSQWTALATLDSTKECELCKKMTTLVVSVKGQSYDMAKSQAVSSLKLFPAEQRTFLSTLIQYNFRKIYLDVNSPANLMTATSTCADFGYCDAKDQFKPTFQIVNLTDDFWNDHSNEKDVRDKTIIVLHDTEDATLNLTLEVLKERGLSVHYVIDRDGQIYQLVDDSRRAWQAGTGVWRGDGCESGDTNTRSVGIETVNSGAEPFPDAQVRSIHALIDFLRTKWHVEPQNIIAHHENGPNYKFDISGYFSWRGMYDVFGVFGGLWDSKLNTEEMHQVVLDENSQNSALLQSVQQMLYNHGYGTLVVGDPYNSSETSKVTTAMAAQSFNRKYAPEVFVLEKMVNGDQIVSPENQRVYRLTMERLDWLASRQKSIDCTNY